MEVLPLSTSDITTVLVDTILELKGKDILVLDMVEQCIFANQFVICTASNTRQMKAIAHATAFESKKQLREIALHTEGNADDGWMLVDFGHAIVHIFLEEKRNFYNLEELWQNARVMTRIHE